MAERAAHIAPTAQVRPSVFEVIAQDSMSMVFHPALRRLATFLATANPDRYGWLISWYEEVYLAFNTFLQYHYLRYHGASFSEFFYGLQRVSQKRQTSFPRLPGKEEKLSLVSLTLLPYVRAKLENLATKYRLEGRSSHWSDFIVGVYRSLNMVWESTLLAKYLSYLMGYTVTHSPLLDLVGVTLQYATEEKTEDKHCLRLPEVSLKTLGMLFTYSLEFGAFFLQFLQWWYASDKNPANFGTLPCPPAPQVTKARNQYDALCALCLQNRRIDTLLSTSGYVFCYRCIVQYLRQNAACPVTRYPSSEEDLIRLHIGSS